MNVYKWTFWTLVVGLAVLILTSFVVLTVAPEFRRQAFTYVVPAYNIYQTMFLRRYVRERDFRSAAMRLEGQMDWANRLSSARSPMALGLVEAFDLVVEQARFAEDFEPLKGPLERLVEMEPELFLARLWLARALWYVDPEASLAHLTVAAELTSADERSYRQGLETALKLGRRPMAKAYCQAYKSAQFGGPKPRSYYHLYRGLGLRHLGLASHSVSGQTIIVTNSGLVLNQTRTYSFSLPNVMSTDTLDLHLGTLPGLEISLSGVTVATPQGTIDYSPGELTVTSRSAYISGESAAQIRLMTTSSDDERLRVRLPEAVDQIERVSFDLHFRRLPLANGDICASLAG